MTDERILKTDREGARRLSAMIGRPDDTPEAVGSQIDVTKPVIVKIRSAISAGDYQQKDAMLMTISGGALNETGQLVKVRHVGEGSVAANTIVIPEPCGKHGLCFVRQSAGTPIVTTPVNRYQRVMYPVLDDDLERANANWKLGTQWQAPFGIAGGGYGYFMDFDLGTTVDGQVGSQWYWERYLYPIRFRVHSHSDGWKGGDSNTLVRNSRTLASPLEQLMFGLKDAGISMLTVGPDAHISPMQLTHIAPHLGCFYHMTTHQFFSNALILIEAWVTHVRIWIDEVDATGIHEVNQRIVSAGPDQSRFYYGQQMAGVALDDPGVYESKSVWFDFWVKVKLTQYGGSFSPAGSVAQVFWAHSNGGWNTPSLLYSDPNANRAATDDYEFTLSTAGPGSATAVTTVDGQTNWTRIQSAYSYRMTWAGGGSSSLGGFILFDWGRETPWIQLAWNARLGSPSGANGVALYFPEDSADYEAIVFASGYQYKRGVWDPSGVTTFRLAAVRVQNVWIFRYSERVISMESYFTSWPQTISVEKV